MKQMKEFEVGKTYYNITNNNRIQVVYRDKNVIAFTGNYRGVMQILKDDRFLSGEKIKIPDRDLQGFYIIFSAKREVVA